MNQEETPIIDDERFKNCFVSKNVNYAKRKAYHPRLLSVNDIELHKSKVTRNPIAFIGLWFLGIYWKIKKKLKSFHNWLYPRKLIIYGTEKNSEIIGKLVLLFLTKTENLVFLSIFMPAKNGILPVCVLKFTIREIIPTRTVNH
jgi:hypothetical protein